MNVICKDDYPVLDLFIGYTAKLLNKFYFFYITD